MGSINHLPKIIPSAASLTDKLRPLLRGKRKKKDEKYSITSEKIRMGQSTFFSI